MKKIIATTALILAGTVMANAEVQAGAQMKANIKARAVQMMGTSTRPITGTSSDALGLKIKALNMEMEAKIKVIRDEYQAKIKALIIANGGNASTTRPAMGKLEPRPEGDRQGETEDSLAAGSSTDERAVPPMPRLRLDGQVKGVATENDGQGGGFGKFLRGLFGGR